MRRADSGWLLATEELQTRPSAPVLPLSQRVQKSEMRFAKPPPVLSPSLPASPIPFGSPSRARYPPSNPILITCRCRECCLPGAEPLRSPRGCRAAPAAATRAAPRAGSAPRAPPLPPPQRRAGTAAAPSGRRDGAPGRGWREGGNGVAAGEGATAREEVAWGRPRCRKLGWRWGAVGMLRALSAYPNVLPRAPLPGCISPAAPSLGPREAAAPRHGWGLCALWGGGSWEGLAAPTPCRQRRDIEEELHFLPRFSSLPAPRSAFKDSRRLIRSEPPPRAQGIRSCSPERTAPDRARSLWGSETGPSRSSPLFYTAVPEHGAWGRLSGRIAPSTLQELQSYVGGLESHRQLAERCSARYAGSQAKLGACFILSQTPTDFTGVPRRYFALWMQQVNSSCIPPCTLPSLLHTQTPIVVPPRAQPVPMHTLWGQSSSCAPCKPWAPSPANHSCCHQHARDVVLRNNVYDLNPLLRLFN